MSIATLGAIDTYYKEFFYSGSGLCMFLQVLTPIIIINLEHMQEYLCGWSGQI